MKKTKSLHVVEIDSYADFEEIEEELEIEGVYFDYDDLGRMLISDISDFQKVVDNLGYTYEVLS